MKNNIEEENKKNIEQIKNNINKIINDVKKGTLDRIEGKENETFIKEFEVLLNERMLKYILNILFVVNEALNKKLATLDGSKKEQKTMLDVMTKLTNLYDKVLNLEKEIKGDK